MFGDLLRQALDILPEIKHWGFYLADGPEGLRNHSCALSLAGYSDGDEVAAVKALYCPLEERYFLSRIDGYESRKLLWPTDSREIINPGSYMIINRFVTPAELADLLDEFQDKNPE